MMAWFILHHWVRALQPPNKALTRAQRKRPDRLSDSDTPTVLIRLLYSP